MVDIVTLGVNVDTTDLKDGKSDLDQFTAAGVRAEKQTQRLGSTASRAGDAVRRMSGGTGLRMASMQLSQVAQQGAATGNYLQALAIQAPDLALGFGAVGIAVGALVPVLYGLGSAYLDSGDGAQSLDDALADLKETAEGMLVPLDILKMDVDELTEKYGSATERVLGFARAQAELRAAQAEGRLREQVGLLDDVVTGYLSSTKEGGRYEAVLSRIGDEFDVQRAAAEELSYAFEGLYRSGDFESQQAALAEILDVLEENNVEIGKIPEGLQAAIADMITLSNETDRARAIMEQLSAAAAGITVGVPLYNQNISPDDLLPPEKKIVEPPRRSRSGGGGGGAPRVDPREREAARIFDQTRTAAERYAMEIANLNELRDAGYLSEDAHMRAVKMFGEQLLETGDMGKRMGETISDALADMVVNFDNARDAAAGLLQNLARMFATSAFNSLGIDSFISGLFGSANGNVFSGGRAVTAFANGGVVSGPTMFPMRGSQTGLMGEAGPEAIMPLTRLANGKLGVQASGGGSNVTFAPVIDARGADAAAVARIEAALAKAQAEFQNRVISTVQTAQKRRAL